MKHSKRAQEVIDLEIRGLAKVRDALGAEFDDAVDLLLECLADHGKVVVTGVGKSYDIARKVSATLASTGSPSIALNPTQAMHGDLGILCEGDILLALSYSGESEELTALLPSIRRTAIRIVAITGDTTSTLARSADVIIPAAVDREACPFNMAPTASTTAALAVGDALAMVLLEARGFRKEDYANLHPGGAIGRALLVQVSDIMRTGDRMAVVQSGAGVRDALVAMTRARCGSAAVVNAGNVVQGIFTDGDLRRRLARHADLLSMPIDEVMTPDPITVRADQLAADVLHIFEIHKIDDLLVVDPAGCLVGAVDIQDLPKLKIL